MLNFLKFFIKILLKNNLMKFLINNVLNLTYILRYKNLSLEPSCRVRNCSFGVSNSIAANVSISNVELGDFSYIARDSQIQNTCVGRFCSIGPGTRIGLGTHPIREVVSTHPYFYSSVGRIETESDTAKEFREFSDIKIGNDVWIGANVIVLDNVEIANGAIIGAGSVVNKNVGPYEIVGGTPARTLKYRFDESTRNTLETINIYSWPLAKINKVRREFGNIEKFLDWVRIHE